MATRILKPICKLKRAVNLDAYCTALRASVPGVHIPRRCKALDWTRRPKRQPKPVAPPPQAGHLPGRGSSPRRGDLAKPPTPRLARAAGAPKPALAPARFGPGAIIKYGTMDPPKFTLVDDDETDDPAMVTNDPELRKTWNEWDETERAFWMGWSHSVSPAKAFEAYKAAKGAAARQAEDAQAAQRRTYQNIVATARAAKATAAGAASRTGTNGAGTPH